MLKKSIIIRGYVVWYSWKYINQKAMLAWATLQSFWLIAPAKVMSIVTEKGTFSPILKGKLKSNKQTNKDNIDSADFYNYI